VTLFELPGLGRFYRSGSGVVGHGALFMHANHMCSVGVRLGLMEATRRALLLPLSLGIVL
jgi:hypothetical protein